jgi:hypothetical protein
MGIQIAHLPVVKTLDDFDFKFQPSIDGKLVRELATDRFIAQTENILLFGPPGVGKSPSSRSRSAAQPSKPATACSSPPPPRSSPRSRGR